MNDNKKRDWNMLWQLFKATFLLSAFTFGGGFVIVFPYEEEVFGRTSMARRK